MTWLAQAAAPVTDVFSVEFLKWIGTNFGFGGVVSIILLVIGRKALVELRDNVREELRKNRESTDDSAEAILECTMALPFIAHEHRTMMEKTSARIKERKRSDHSDS